MKKLMGQRQTVDPELKTGIALLSLFSLRDLSPTKIQFNKSCAKCSAPIALTLTEEVETGQIWIEGPDNCLNCSNVISDPNAQSEMLDQKTIARFFGEY